MSVSFDLRAPFERAYTRTARLIVETVDAITLEPVHDGLTVTATGLVAQPIVSSGGRFVWFSEKGATPTQIDIDPSGLPYLPVSAPIPALPPPPPPPAQPQTWNFMRFELAPSLSYPFAAGVTGVRGTLIRTRLGQAVPLLQVDVHLQWIDDKAAGTSWVDAPTPGRTNTDGDFVAVARLAPSQIARTDAQHRVRVRVAATRAGNTLFSPELRVPFGRIMEAQQSFAWDEFQP